jgi:branched-chain amino acid transport system permease protein
MKIFNKRIRFDLVIALLALALPLFIKNDYYLRVVNMVLLYSVVALSINLVVGFCGQLDFGRAAFVGLGAYCSALMMLKLHLPFWISFIGGGLFAAFFGMLLGLLCMKSSFDYLTLITIGFLEIVRLVLLNWIPVTNGAMGLRRVPPPSFFGYSFDTNVRYFYFSLVFLAISYVAIECISKSKIGRAFGALRDDPIAAAYSGINVPLFKMINFALASFFSGLAGSALVHYTQYASPYNYTLDQSIYQLQFAIIGGLGSLFGSVIGTAILVVAPEISRVFYEYRLMFLGIIMVVMMMYAPNGILGKNGIGEKVIGLSRFLPIKKQTKTDDI